jgi:hypothetical protein
MSVLPGLGVTCDAGVGTASWGAQCAEALVILPDSALSLTEHKVNFNSLTGLIRSASEDVCALGAFNHKVTGSALLIEFSANPTNFLLSPPPPPYVLGGRRLLARVGTALQSLPRVPFRGAGARQLPPRHNNRMGRTPERHCWRWERTMWTPDSLQGCLTMTCHVPAFECKVVIFFSGFSLFSRSRFPVPLPKSSLSSQYDRGSNSSGSSESETGMIVRAVPSPRRPIDRRHQERGSLSSVDAPPPTFRVEGRTISYREVPPAPLEAQHG